MQSITTTYFAVKTSLAYFYYNYTSRKTTWRSLCLHYKYLHYSC